MRQVTRKGLITVAAAGGVLAALSGSTAHADSGAQGSSQGSPGVLSGNTVEVPVNVPVNVCGNSANVVGGLNPATGNGCSNDGADSGGEQQGGQQEQEQEQQGTGSGSQAQGAAEDSPGVGSGNNAQAPVDVPVNACGNTADVVGLLNPATGNECSSDGSVGTPPVGQGPGGGSEQGDGGPGDGGRDSGQDDGTTPEGGVTPEGQREQPHHPDVRGSSEPEAGQTHGDSQLSADAGAPAELAETGSGAGVGTVGALGAGMLVGGYVLYRRGRVLQR